MAKYIYRCGFRRCVETTSSQSECFCGSGRCVQLPCDATWLPGTGLIPLAPCDLPCVMREQVYNAILETMSGKLKKTVQKKLQAILEKKLDATISSMNSSMN